MHESVKQKLASKHRQRRRERKGSAAAHISIEMRVGPGLYNEVTFGEVTARVPAPSADAVRRNVQASSAALKGLVDAFTNPSRTRLGKTKDVPFFHADPDQPGRLIRKLNGRRERGFLRNGVFEVTE